jgi:hypothetical protein
VVNTPFKDTTYQIVSSTTTYDNDDALADIKNKDKIAYYNNNNNNSVYYGITDRKDNESKFNKKEDTLYNTPILLVDDERI